MNSMTIGFGNNSASLLAAILVICSVFALLPATGGTAAEAYEILTEAGPGNTALSFYWVPALFQQMPGGRLSLILFFLALVVAAVSSLIAMIELATRIFVDAGMSRHRAVLFVTTVGFVLGAPSAVSLEFFTNQDTVWGIGLMVSGFFFAMAVRKYGVARFREELIEPADNDLPVGRWFDILVKYVLPVEFLVMVTWWLYQATISEPDWWNPFAVFSLGTCVFQWGVAMLVFRFLNGPIADRTLGDGLEEEAA
jgi:NSS family neurotransmitter:Na+ symporter